ncbi:hypothetical protein Pelo_5061 [Pelomyxa schiedti]|nr:hypothetical protein Pelo_5061 [Pelomyxa schiedti]
MQYLKGSDIEGSKLSLYPPETLSQICTDFGCICSFDVLVNNSDRFPVIWDNEGNMGNLFIVSGRGYAIDNAICSIDPAVFPENYFKYINKVQGFLQTITNS